MHKLTKTKKHSIVNTISAQLRNNPLLLVATMVAMIVSAPVVFQSSAAAVTTHRPPAAHITDCMKSYAELKTDHNVIALVYHSRHSLDLVFQPIQMKLSRPDCQDAAVTRTVTFVTKRNGVSISPARNVLKPSTDDGRSNILLIRTNKIVNPTDKINGRMSITVKSKYAKKPLRSNKTIILQKDGSSQPPNPYPNCAEYVGLVNGPDSNCVAR
jgi:hypothetical protein